MIASEPKRAQASLMLGLITSEVRRLPFVVMQDCGSAVLTFAGLASISTKETFTPVESIAEAAFVPVATARKHLAKLELGRWIENQGRKKTRYGYLRRTATLRFTEQGVRAWKESCFGMLPWWFIRGAIWSWPEKAIMSTIYSRLYAMKAALIRITGEEWNSISRPYGEELYDELDGQFNFRERFRVSNQAIAETTGLSHGAIVKAIRSLERRRFLLVEREEGRTNVLIPNKRYMVIVSWPASDVIAGPWTTFSDSG